MSLPLPLKLSSLVAKEVHVQNKIVFSNPAVVLTGSNTSLLFDRLHTLEDEVSELQAGGGGGPGMSTPEFIFPSITCRDFQCLSNQLLEGENLNPNKIYNTFGRFAYPALDSNLIGTKFPLPAARSQTHFRIFNETDLSVFPLTTSLVLEYLRADGITPDVFSMSSELISARNSTGSWTFYNGS